MMAPSQPAAAYATLRVLVADDEPAIREVYQALFETMGGRKHDANAKCGLETPLEFTLCAAGNEAWEAVQTACGEGRPFGVIFMDVRMPPGPDGVATAERIRTVDSQAFIVMVTGFSDFGIEEIARRVTPRDRLLYLQKPFHIHEIREIATALGTRWLNETRSGCGAPALIEAAAPGDEADDKVLSLKERYLDIFENAVDMLFVHRLDGEFISVSPGFTRITGQPVEAAIGRNVLEYIAPEFHDYVKLIAANKIRGLPAPQVFEVEILGLDGRRAPVEVNSWPVFRNGRAVAIQGIARDISERRKAEELRQALEKQLRQSQRLESIGRLAGGIAHDFNNLLTAIMGSGEMLLIGLDVEHHGRRRVEEILTAAQRAAMLTRQLLAFSRRQIMQPRTLSVNRIVTEMDALLRRVIGEDIELRTRLEPGLAPIKADPGQLEQVVVNLVVNARDAMPNGGKLTLSTALAELAGTHTEGEPDGAFAIRPGRYVRLTVEDNGVGMAPEVRGHVFEPFFSTKTQDGKGTGLGLATVYGIVKQSGGYIWFDTEVGAGTAFHLLFPLAEEGAVCEASPPPPRMLDVPGGHETVLLAEDDDALRSLVSRILRGHGYTVIDARDGHEALQRSREEQGTIDLVLTDVVMPQMGGRQLAATLMAERPDIGVVLMSGYTDQETVHLCLEETGGEFLQKPFTPTTLVKKLRRILDAKK